jgi:CheY-like chemotaxis protein
VKQIWRIAGMNKILITDDDDELRANLSDILKGKGYGTDEAASGEEAIEKVKSEDFDIVLLDLMMPMMSGMDVLLEIKKTKPRIDYSICYH